MKVYGVPLAECEHIAASLQMRLERPVVLSKNCVQFGIRRSGPDAPWRKHGYQTRKDGAPRTAGAAVCWHGHREFFDALFTAFPDARVKTWMATYNGDDDFTDKFSATRSMNVGSVAHPRKAGQMCDCER